MIRQLLDKLWDTDDDLATFKGRHFPAVKSQTAISIEHFTLCHPIHTAVPGFNVQWLN